MAMQNFLTLKEAARRLGVHENTLRNWERRGLIRLIRLPGSRYRRVPVAEVERLLAQMEGTRVSTGEVRLEPPPADQELLAQGQVLAQAVKEELARTQWSETLEETMQRLRGRVWSS